MKLDSGVRMILEKLHSAGYEAYIVGGAVRNDFLGLPVYDYDFTTSALPAEVFSVFKDCNTFAPGLKHGTVCVEIDRKTYEITTYRAESRYVDNRHPTEICFIPDLKEDLKRRDFTVNAMCFDGEKTVDIFNGARDCKEKIIRCIGDPAERFEEDALRILRALRFSSQLSFAIEENTKKAIFTCKRLLLNISAERIREEFNKLLLGKNCKNVLLEYRDVVAEFIPELAPCFDFDQRSKFHSFDVYTHLVRAVDYCPEKVELRLTALLHDIGKPSCFFTDEEGEGHFYGHPKAGVPIARRILDRLKYPNAVKEKVLLLIEYHDAPIVPKQAEAGAIDKYVLRALNKFGEQGFFDLLDIKRADNKSKKDEECPYLAHLDLLEKRARELIEKSACFSLRDLAVKGNDILSLGARGKVVGEALNYLLDSVINGAVENDKNELIRVAETYLSSSH